MKSTDVLDRELMHGQTLDFLTTDADIEARVNVETIAVADTAVKWDYFGCQHLDIDMMTDLGESTLTEPFTLHMSCVHGLDVENEVNKPGLAIKPEDATTSVTNVDDKRLPKTQPA